MNSFPKVGVGVFIIKDGKILFGKRKGSHGQGTWSLPGGHLEYKENIVQCAVREVYEEVGIKIKNVREINIYTNDIFEKEDKHYVTLYVFSEYDSGEIKNIEPDKCEKWDWFDWNELPEPLFTPIINLKKKKFNPLDFSKT